MHFRSPVTDAATLAPSSNIWRGCQWNQALHEFRLIIHIRAALQARLTSAAHSQLSRKIMELCPLHAQRPAFMGRFFFCNSFECTI